MTSTRTPPADKREFTPHFIAYASSNGNTPEKQLEVDDKKFPGGKMCGFILWISANKQAFRKKHPEALCGDAICDHDAWVRFLGGKSLVNHGKPNLSQR